MGERVLASGVVWWSDCCFAGRVRLDFFLLAIGFCLIAVPVAQGQEAVSMQVPLGTGSASGVQPVATKSVPEKAPVAQEITFGRLGWSTTGICSVTTSKRRSTM
jgi:hypothetical protein